MVREAAQIALRSVRQVGKSWRCTETENRQMDTEMKKEKKINAKQNSPAFNDVSGC